MKKTLLLACFSSLFFTTTAFSQIFMGITNWQSHGVGGGGAVFNPTISPHTSNEIFVPCDMSELFTSKDFGKSWSQIPHQQLFANKESRMFFTSDPNVVYTLYCDASSNQYTVRRSTDAGKTFSKLANDPTGGDVWGMLVNPQSTNQLLVADYKNAYFSNDGGQSFSKKFSTSSGSGCLLAGALWDGNNIYVGTNMGFYTSTNGGNTFALSTATGIPSTESMVSFTGAKQGNALRFFCVTLIASGNYPGITGADYSSYKGVYSLNLGDVSWAKKITGIPAAAKPFFAGMAQNDINTAYVAGSNGNGAPLVCKTTDGGATWKPVFNTTLNQNINTGWCGDGGDRGWSYPEYALGFAVAPTDAKKLVITDLGFAHVSADGGVTWQQAYDQTADQNPVNATTPKRRAYHGVGLENTTNWQIMWADKQTMVASFSDIQGIRSTDAGQSWSFPDFTNNSTYYVLKHPTSNTLYAATSSVHDMYQSTYLLDSRIDGGRGNVMLSSNNGLNWTLLHDFAHPVIWLALDPTNPNRMYASVIHSTQGGIFVTNNLQSGSSSTWTKVTNPPRTQGHPFNVKVLNDGTLIATYSGRRGGSPVNFTASSGVFMSADQGQTWTDRSDINMQYWTKDITIDPFDATQNTWYVGVFSGYGGAANGKGGLYKTINRGQTWTKLIGVPTVQSVTSCTINPQNKDELWFTTETNGLWHSTNLTSGTPSFNQDQYYPFRQPERVVYNPYDNSEVWVTSFGNGMRMGKTGGFSIQNINIKEKHTFTLFPNPALTSTTIDFTIKTSGLINISILDITGKTISVRKNEQMMPGHYQHSIYLDDLSSGLYFIKLTTGDGSSIQKLMVN